MCQITTITYHIIQKNLHYNVKVETTAKINFVYVSLLKQQGNGDFEFISVSFSAATVGYIRYQHTISLKSYDLKIESFCFL